MSSTEPPSEIERYVPAGEIQDRQAAELAVMGLSAQFPEKVQRLNTNLLEGYNTYGSHPFTGYRFSLMPDQDHPRVDVAENRSFPYKVTVDADMNKHATFTVESVYGSSGAAINSHVINWVGHSGINAFFQSYPGEYDVRVGATRLDQTGRPINLSLSELPDEAAFAESGIVKDEYALVFGFVADEHTSLHLPVVYTNHAGRNARVFGIGNIIVRDAAANVEQIIDAYGQLIIANNE